MAYRVVCWIPIDEEEFELFDNYEDAREELIHCEEIQPENKYEIINYDEI